MFETHIQGSSLKTEPQTCTWEIKLVCLFVCLGRVLCPVSVPCGTGYTRRVFQINEGMMPYPGVAHIGIVTLNKENMGGVLLSEGMTCIVAQYIPISPQASFLAIAGISI